MKKIGMMVLLSLFLHCILCRCVNLFHVQIFQIRRKFCGSTPGWHWHGKEEKTDTAAEDAVEDVTFSELVEDVLTGEFSFSMEDLWERLGEVAFGELRTQTGLTLQ